MENIPIRKRKIFQLEKGKYFQSETVNWKMAEEEQKNKRITPLERARNQQFQVLRNYFSNLENEIIHISKLKIEASKYQDTNS